MTDQLGYRAGEFVGRCDGIPILDRSRHLAFANFMPEDWATGMLSWGQDNAGRMEHVGDSLSFQASSSMPDLARECPQSQALLDAIVAQCGVAAIECEVPVPTDHVHVEAWLSHRGEGDHFHWHTDRDPIADELQTRVLSFCYYFHSEPCQFIGGELEFFDGVMLQPRHNQLVFFPPFQIHRVRHVHVVPRGWGGSDDDGSPTAVWPDSEPVHYLDGRWTIIGWIHSREPVAESTAY